MAGSYSHVLSGWSRIENMGDAYEAVEELMWLVERGMGREEAQRLLDDEFYPMERGEVDPDPHLIEVRRLMESE